MPEVVLLAIPGLFADDILSLTDAGRLPAFKNLIEEGTFGYIKDVGGSNITQDLWTLACGVPPAVHGVRGPYGVMPEASDIYPVGRGASRVAPLWEITAEQGLESACVCWPATKDTAADNLLVVTQDIHTPFGAERDGWPLLPGALHPPEWQAAFQELRVHPSEISEAETAHFGGAESASALRMALAAAATVQAITLHLIELRRFGLLAVHFDVMDRLRRLSVGPNGMLAGYRFVDLLVGNLKATLPKEGILVLASGAVARSPGEVAPGILTLSGDGIEADKLLAGAQLLDVAPTVLYAAGAAIPDNWEGNIHREAWCSAEPVCRAASSLSAKEPGDAWVLQAMQRQGLAPPKPLADRRRVIAKLVQSLS